ncbi:MAG: ribosome maturation factor RimP [Gammaproteobacteria bacterium]|nr:ribosome maturation factor RimP [Gammaproteobacteria bacterium]
MASVQQTLEQLVEPVVTAMGYELVLLEYSPHKGSALVRLYIDAPGGITLGDCESVSREVEGVLDVEDPIPHNYRLEVSSPGLDRPLVKLAHFERFAGETAQIHLRVPRPGAGNRRRFVGTLAGVQGDTVLLDTPEGRVEIGLSEIERARLVPSFEAKEHRSRS